MKLYHQLWQFHLKNWEIIGQCFTSVFILKVSRQQTPSASTSLPAIKRRITLPTEVPD